MPRAKPKQHILDTNYIIHLVVRDVPSQTDIVARLVSEASVKSLIVSDVVFAEAVFVLEKFYEFERKIIAQALGFVLEHPAFDISTSRHKDAFTHYLAHRKLSYVDCYAWAQAEAGNQTLLTFDKDLDKAAKKSAGRAKLLS